MELHSQALNFLCRLCGRKLSKYSHNKFELKRKVEKVCDIDVSNDTTLLHPPKVWDTCRRKLDRKFKEKQKETKTKKAQTNSFNPSSSVDSPSPSQVSFHSRKKHHQNNRLQTYLLSFFK